MVINNKNNNKKKAIEENELFSLSKIILNDLDKYYKKSKKGRKVKMYKYVKKNKPKEKQFKVSGLYYRNKGDKHKKYVSEYFQQKHFWVKYIVKKLVKYSIYNKAISKDSLLKYFLYKYSKDLTHIQIEKRINSTLNYLLQLKNLCDLRDLDIILPTRYSTVKVMKNNKGEYYLWFIGE